MFNKFRKKLEQELAEKVYQVQSGARKTVEKINPFDEESKQNRKTKKLQEFTDRSYGLTDKTKEALADTFISVGEGEWQNTSNLKSSKALGRFSASNNEIKVADEDGMGGANVFRHEALHRLWETMDEESRQQFQSLIESQEQTDPYLAAFLERRLKNYANPDNLDEKHSFAAEFYDLDKKLNFEDGTSADFRMPDELRKHYSKYYNPSRKRERDDIAREIMKMTGFRRQ